MAPVPSGRFTLGETPQKAELQPFCLDVIEVTVSAYRACVTRGECPASEAGTEYFLGKPQSANCSLGKAARENHPMNCLDWEQAKAFCEGQGRRLPTEAEWEWAARGGDEARTFPWGTAEPGARACWSDTGSLELSDVERIAARNGTCPVGSHVEDTGRFGHKDLAANVAEWTASFGTASASSRILRGGSWAFGAPSTLRASFRESIAAPTRLNSVGFRCAK